MLVQQQGDLEQQSCTPHRAWGGASPGRRSAARAACGWGIAVRPCAPHVVGAPPGKRSTPHPQGAAVWNPIQGWVSLFYEAGQPEVNRLLCCFHHQGVPRALRADVTFSHLRAFRSAPLAVFGARTYPWAANSLRLGQLTVYFWPSQVLVVTLRAGLLGAAS